MGCASAPSPASLAPHCLSFLLSPPGRPATATGVSGTSGAEGGSACSHPGPPLPQQTVAVAGAGVPRQGAALADLPPLCRAAEPAGATDASAPEAGPLRAGAGVGREGPGRGRGQGAAEGGMGPWLLCVWARSCSSLCNPTDCSPPGPSAHRISQARILQWVALSLSRGSSRLRAWTRILQLRAWTRVSGIGRRILNHSAIRLL